MNLTPGRWAVRTLGRTRLSHDKIRETSPGGRVLVSLTWERPERIVATFATEKEAREAIKAASKYGSALKAEIANIKKALGALESRARAVRIAAVKSAEGAST